MSDSRVLVCRHPRQSASVHLICFPWAGGGTLYYTNWSKHLPDHVQAVCPAGRETRYKESAYTSLQTFLDDVTSAIHKLCQGKPFALWGHSFGGLCVYECAYAMKTKYNMEPSHMFVSGVSAPHSEKRKQSTLSVKDKTDDELIDILKSFGGTPSEVLENKEVMKFFLPPLRVDYNLLTQIGYDPPSERCVLTCPVDVFDGAEDTPHDLDSWKEVTAGPFSISLLPGGHFYLQDQSNITKLCQHINYVLSR